METIHYVIILFGIEGLMLLIGILLFVDTKGRKERKRLEREEDRRNGIELDDSWYL